MNPLPRQIFALLVVLVSLLTLRERAFGATFSFAEDFRLPPNHQNTAEDTWQFFHSIDLEQRLGDYPRIPVFETAYGYQAWTMGSSEFPLIGKNTTNDDIFGVRPSEGIVHPSNDGLGLAIAFQAPTNGLYDISGYIRPSNPGYPSGIRWFIDKENQAGNLESGVLVPIQQHRFHFRAVELKKGERVYLIVQSNGDYRGDTTAVGFDVFPTQLSLELALRPVVTVTGLPGNTYRVEALDALAPTFAWKPVTNITLTTPTATVVDFSASGGGQRYYRAVRTN